MFMGVDGCWCARWSSKPVEVVNSCFGGFDSHIFPPISAKSRQTQAAFSFPKTNEFRILSEMIA